MLRFCGWSKSSSALSGRKRKIASAKLLKTRRPCTRPNGLSSRWLPARAQLLRFAGGSRRNKTLAPFLEKAGKRRLPMRLAGRERLGFYPLPTSEAERIRRFLAFPDKQCCALDPCIGEGAAFAVITSDKKVLRQGVELDAGRAEQARAKGNDVIHGNCFDVQSPVESFSLIYLNPPYDFEISEEKSQRMEKLFLEHVYRWLKPGGILVLVVPAKRVADCTVLLSRHFRDIRVYRLTEPESVRYGQVAVFGVRRTRQERDRLRDAEIIQAQLWLASVEREVQKLSTLPLEPDHLYATPPGAPVRLVHRGLPLDQIEDLLPKSSAYRQASAVLFAQQADDF